LGGVLVGFAVIGFVIFIGYLAARYELAGPHAADALTRTAFFITNPALLFIVMAKADLSVVFSAYVPLALITSLTTAGLYVLFSRIWFPRPAPETAIAAMGSSYVNAGNIGIALAIYVLGNATPVAPVLIVQMLLLAPMYLMILDMTAGRKPSFKDLVTQPVRNPITIASVLGTVVAATGISLPGPVMAPLEMLGGAAVPLVLMVFGMSLRGSRPLALREGRTEVVVATALKALVMPVITYLLGRFAFRLEGEQLFGVLVMAALPAAQNAFLFASRYGRGVAVARDIVLFSSVLAVPVLVGTAWLLA
jgi:predicted permease